MTTANHAVGPAWRDTILYGGLTAGLLDAFDAVIFFGARGVPPDRIARFIASALLGPTALSEGGAGAVVLGTILHFAVAICIATVLFAALTAVPALLRRPVIVGLGAGAIAYFVMTHVVVPLSRVTPSNRPTPLPVLINGVVGHAVLVGLPIVLWAARSSRRRRASG